MIDINNAIGGLAESFEELCEHYHNNVAVANNYNNLEVTGITVSDNDPNHPNYKIFRFNVFKLNSSCDCNNISKVLLISYVYMEKKI